jgi:uncharacterized protein YbcC (UPF0753/DUF2309 family)
MATDPATTTTQATTESASGPTLDALRQAMEQAARILPAQGPITAFIHHNTLHAFEPLPFDEASRAASRLYGCQPYLPEERYRAELGRGRIRNADLVAVLQDDLGPWAGDAITPQATRMDLRLAMLQHAVWTGRAAELRWFVAETDALRAVRPDVSAATRRALIAETRRWALRDLRTGALGGPTPRRRFPDWAVELLAGRDTTEIENWDESRWEALALEALWRACREGLATLPPAVDSAPPPIRHQELLAQATGIDADEPVHELLIRFCAAYMDQGLSHWALPGRDAGLLQSFCGLYRRSGGPPDRALRGLPAAAAELQDSGMGALESVRASLDDLGVPPAEWEDYLRATFLALRGWAGIIQEVERRSDRVPLPVPGGTLAEFLAVRLLLDRVVLRNLARDELDFVGTPAALRAELHRRQPERPPLTLEQRAFPLYQLAQAMGWSVAELCVLPPATWARLVEEVESFHELERRRVFHLAYERRFREQALDALALHPGTPPAPGVRPRFQIMTCLDAREESLRRHLEELAPDVETFGVAGFFGVAMYYRGAADAHYTPLCPIVIQPGHWIEERVDEAYHQSHRRRSRTRRALGAASHRFHMGSRGFALGALLTGGLGVLASVPLVVRILFPGLAERVRRRAASVIRTPRATRLVLQRCDDPPAPEEGHLGYSLDEMTNLGERLLRDIGLVDRFARLVFVIGHGSFHLNNPHKSGYDCGACGGGPGGPNGRAMAEILNHPVVRKRLHERGLVVPDDTWFLGAFHNTCDDTIRLADVDLVPETHRQELQRAQNELESTLGRNAHERCRRFMSAPLDLSFEGARAHVASRSADLAQTRPELGNATNGLCVVARRWRTRGLYLDRRAFLTSYDPTRDDDRGTVLARILAAAVPVCAGISLQYFYSRVDPQRLGAGTKLPHNITSLLGVMDGAASDLRTGLPWQMVEIHEPLRLLFVIETTPAIIEGIIAENPVIAYHVHNEWIQLALMDPHDGSIRLWKKGEWVPYEPQTGHLPASSSSADWYRGWRDHLEFAEILPGTEAEATSGR